MPRPLIHTPRLTAMIAALLIASGAMFFINKCSHRQSSPFSADMPRKSGGDTIDVAIEISPLSYSLAGDTVSGLDYDLLRTMCALHGRAVKFHPFAPMDYAMRGIKEGNFDLVVASLASTKQLKENLTLTDQVYLDHEVLLQRKDAGHFVHSAEELGGDTVFIGDGSPFMERLANLADEIGDTIFVMSTPGRTAEHLAIMVKSGSIPRAVISKRIADKFTERDSALDASTAVSFTQFQVWGLHKDNTALRDTLNAWLASFRATPQYREILNRY